MSKETKKPEKPVFEFPMEGVTNMGHIFGRGKGGVVVIKATLNRKVIPVRGRYETDDEQEIEWLRQKFGKAGDDEEVERGEWRIPGLELEDGFSGEFLKVKKALDKARSEFVEKNEKAKKEGKKPLKLRLRDLTNLVEKTLREG